METKKYSFAENEIKSVIDIDGFPIGKNEDIISLSDPPYFTMCPNPLLMQFIKEYGINYDEINDSYHREPYASDIVEGKNDPIYNAHTYHTKVPHKAIMRYILHYTNPNDIIFDGFCGTGMTGVATSLCNSNDFILRNEISKELPIKPSWGKRYAILNDLCPSATFISYNYNHKFDSELFRKTAYNILKEVDKECSWMYVTRHTLNNKKNNTFLLSDEKESYGRINYTVWSDIYLCNNCNKTFSFWDVSMDIESGHK